MKNSKLLAIIRWFCKPYVSVRFYKQTEKPEISIPKTHSFNNIKANELRFKQYFATCETGNSIDNNWIKQRLLNDLIKEIDKDGFVTIETTHGEMPLRKRTTVSLWVSLNAH